jgi:polar amino acid transport system substrate-binding protein
MLRWIVLLWGLWGGVTVHAAVRMVSVGWDDYPPYQMATAGEQQGIDMDIVRSALERAGYQVNFIKLPWARQLLMLKNGNLALSMSASKSEERARYAVWSNVYRSEGAALIGLQSNPATITSLKQLRGQNIKIGLIRDSSYPGEYESLLVDPQFRQLLEFTTINLQNLAKLRRGRINYLIDDPVTIQYQAKMNPGPDVRVMLEIANEGSHFMVSKNFVAGEPAFIGRLNDSLDTLKRDGTIKRIFSKYGESN